MDAAISWPNGKHYLFSGPTYQRWDAETGVCETADAAISGAWGTLWADGIDAGLYWGCNKAFFFKGGEYCRYDCKTNTVDYVRRTADHWPGLWTDGIEACLNWANGKIYIFRAGEYVRWDIGFDRMDEGYPRPIVGAWNGIWDDGVDAALYPGGNEVYFFKGENYRVFDIAANTSDGIDRPISSFAPAPVPRGLLKATRDLSRKEAAGIVVWQADNGIYNFKAAWMAARRGATGSKETTDANHPITIEPRRCGKAEYVSGVDRQGQTVDDLDPRMLVAFERLGRWLKADHAGVEAVMHLGIGRDGSNQKDFRNQGRALDLSGTFGAIDGEVFILDVTRGRSKQSEGERGDYRLDADPLPFAYDLFMRADAFGTYECECNRGNVWPPTEIGGGFVICSDYWGEGGVGSQKLRRDHNDYIQLQIGWSVAQ